MRGNGEILRLEAGGAVLGVFPEWPLLLFTDGITEASNARDEEFGEERLAQLASALRDRGAHELKNRILQTISSYSGGRAQDDATLVVVAIQ